VEPHVSHRSRPTEVRESPKKKLVVRERPRNETEVSRKSTEVSRKTVEGLRNETEVLRKSVEVSRDPGGKGEKISSRGSRQRLGEC
jgi:hypothetical protein